MKGDEGDRGDIEVVYDVELSSPGSPRSRASPQKKFASRHAVERLPHFQRTSRVVQLISHHAFAMIPASGWNLTRARRAL
jgi:hypothetical protein